MVYLIEVIPTENDSIHFDVYEKSPLWPRYLYTYRYYYYEPKMEKRYAVTNQEEIRVINLIEKIYNI